MSETSPEAPLRASPVQAVEALAPERPLGVVLTCEHASNRLWDLARGEACAWPEEDAHLAADHWAWDPGAGDLTRLLAQRLGAGAVLARFTRLQCDANRDHWEPTLMREACDGHVVTFNRGLTEGERQRRLDRLWAPYHAASAALVAAVRPQLVLSLHSFTPIYEGSRRKVEVGVLHHSPESALPAAFYDAFSAYRGPLGPLVVRYNEPWPGTVMYGPDRCAAVASAVPIELEFRNDLVTQPEFRHMAAEVVERTLRDAGLLGR